VVEVHEGFGVTVEMEGTFIQGIFGIGGETSGEIEVAVKSPAEDLAPGAVQVYDPAHVV
jgi:hypothetical protein